MATHVRDVDSLGLMELAGGLNRGRLQAGEELEVATDFLLMAAANPFLDTPERLEAKIDAGAQMFQTNIVYDVDAFAQWVAPLVAAGLSERAPLLVGLTPPRSRKMLEFLHEKIPGVEVDESTFARMDGLEGEEAKAAGIEIAADVIERARAIPGVAGVHVMAPGWEAEAVPRLLGL